MKEDKILIFIPTYNEKDNVEKIYLRILHLNLPADILFIDDNSPDGTGALLDDLAKERPGFKVIHRPGKMGVGSAHLMAIDYAYENRYNKLVTMDCDFTHSPEYLPVFIKYAKDYEIIIGSRYMHKESLSGWNPFRKILTLLGHILTKYLLNMPYDATGAYRVYRLDRIPQKVFRLVRSPGYSFFFESLYVLYINGFSIKEIPIALPPRTYGSSKMSKREIARSIKYLFYTYTRSLINKNKLKISV